MDGVISDIKKNENSYETVTEAEQRIRDLEIETRNLKLYAKETRTVLSVAILFLILVVGLTL